ncbi:hypothetical protein Mgra_00005280 [Meloidogyne graminicola]|uniref:ShKT domain-containing protein n=1 Tax=Meloidogyne graminicola TaxID=189291 RepID=A0A8S9ZQ53_9BILA|nr:hypothetical protein Mgra_00005280 [Meloidogyne graminicola]
MNEATKYDLKIPRTYECKDRQGEKYCLSKVLTKGNACKYKPRILDRCQKSCGICFPKRNKCQNKEGYERRCKRWDHNNFCLGKKFSLAIKLHYCPEQCNLCDKEDDEKKDEKDDDYSNEDEEKGKKKWFN